ncbi:MAG TPA: hypothetical protein VKR82_13620 [Candidatus Acidoferrales bacterium]|nr:hypothetical protein [Candidatus Acidoferrales bacterium]
MSESDLIVPLGQSISVLPTEQDRAEVLRTNDLAVAASQTITPQTIWQLAFSFPAMLGVILVGAVGTIARTFFVDPDVWWHVKFGQVILATHHLPTTDIYSFSVAGQHWIDAEWLGDVLLGGMYRLGGLRGLELTSLILGSAILIALYTLAAMRSGNSKAAFVATAAVFVMTVVSFNLRPQMLGYLFLILTLIILQRFRRGKRRAMWALPILMVVWVNVHPSWIIGLGVIGVYLASGLVEFHLGDIAAQSWSNSDRLRLAIVLGLCGCATFITPYGAALAEFPFKFAFSLPLNIKNILEWLPIPFGSPLGKMFLAAVLGVIAFQVVCRFAWRLEELALFLFTTTMACLHVRFLLIFVPIFTPLLATMLARWVPPYKRKIDRYLLNAAMMATVVAFTIWYFPTQAELLQSAGKTYPVAAVEFLNHNSVPGPMYNNYGFGGYLIWSRGPEHKVFMDGRGELYEPSGVFTDYLEIADIRPSAFSLIKKYGFQSCLIKQDEALATVLAALPDWQRVYGDETSVLYVRRSASPVVGARISSTPTENAHGL